MKKLILLTLLISTAAFSQVPSLTLSAKGFEPAIINAGVNPASTLYNKTISWIEQNYDNPDGVMVANVENKSIEIKAIEKKVWTPNRIGVDNNYNMQYTLKIEFKDGKYRVSYELGNFQKDGKVLTTSYKDLFKKFDGSVKYNYEGAVAGIEKKFNEKNQSLYNFIMGIESGEDW